MPLSVSWPRAIPLQSCLLAFSTIRLARTFDLPADIAILKAGFAQVSANYKRLSFLRKQLYVVGPLAAKSAADCKGRSA